MKRILFFCNDSHSFLHYRKDLVNKCIYLGYRVSCILPRDELNSKIEKLDITVHEIRYKRHFSILYDLITIFSLINILFKNKYDIIQTITLKPNIYGIILAFIFRIKKRYALVTGAGPLLNKRVKAIGVVRKFIIYKLIKISLKLTTKTIFQNKDDIDDFIKFNFINKNQCTLIEGSGVNKNVFNHKIVNKNDVLKIKHKYQIKNNEKVILLVSRMILSKGIIDVFKASKESKSSHRFIIIAPYEKNYFFKEMIDQNTIDKFNNNRLILIDRFVSDIKPYLALCDIAIYPSNYREGIPRFLIEALAFRKPIITKKTPGCKSTVSEFKNGLFINNYKDINKKLDYIFKKKTRYKDYCEESGRLFELRFESKIIVKQTIALYEKN